jgi:uncharacterized protein GlcG (DUF336 family)
MSLTLSLAETILAGVLDYAKAQKLKPLAIVILDERGTVKLAIAQDGTSLKRIDIAHAKAYGAIALGVGSRAIGQMAADRPHFVAAVSHVVGGALVPVAGGVLMRRTQDLIGAIGISGDTSDNDEAAAKAGLESIGLMAETG